MVFQKLVIFCTMAVVPLCYGAKCGPESLENCNQEDKDQIEVLMRKTLGFLTSHLEDMEERRSRVEKDFSEKLKGVPAAERDALLQEMEKELHAVSGSGSYEILKAVAEYKEKETAAAKAAEL